MRQLQLAKIRQRFDRTRLADPIAVLREELSRLDDQIRPDSRIAIAAGSRGIGNLAAVVGELCAYVRARGAHPFVVPAMGSHGGATAEGQAEVLRQYGIDEAGIGAPVRSSMEVVELPQGGMPMRIFMDRRAFESDGVILVNRIKPHTDFHGQYESGLMKMALIGLGKLEGARAVHDYGLYGLRELIAPGAGRVLASGKILAGVALVENAYHETRIVRVLPVDEIAAEEPLLLDAARQSMPRLPMDSVDLLIVDRMGKDISGVGIDPNITGRIGVDGMHDAGGVHVTAMVVCDLTEASHGNAIGVGLADVITRRLYEKIDWNATYANVVTSSFLERGKLPIVAASALDAAGTALRSCGRLPERGARILRIRDTLRLEDVYASPAVVEDLAGGERLELVAPPAGMFDDRGELTAF